jgi:hypothetical protein
LALLLSLCPHHHHLHLSLHIQTGFRPACAAVIQFERSCTVQCHLPGMGVHCTVWGSRNLIILSPPLPLPLPVDEQSPRPPKRAAHPSSDLVTIQSWKPYLNSEQDRLASASQLTAADINATKTAPECPPRLRRTAIISEAQPQRPPRRKKNKIGPGDEAGPSFPPPPVPAVEAGADAAEGGEDPDMLSL